MNKSINLENKNARKKHSKKYMKQLKKKLQISMFSISMVLLLVAGCKLAGLSIPINNIKEDIEKTGLSAEESKTSGEIENKKTSETTNGEEIVDDSAKQEAKNSELRNNELKNIRNTDAEIASGYAFGAALKADGSVWTWGNNTYGQLGNGKIENTNTSEPNRVLGIEGNGYLENIKQISVGAYTTYALTSGGKVLNWGYNGEGELGNNSTANSGTPVYVQKQVEVIDENGKKSTKLVNLDNIIQISAGATHALALASDGTVWSWGRNNYGQLGINVGDTTANNANGKRVYAVKVQKQVSETITNEDGTETTTTHLEDLDNIKQISGGDCFSVALTNEGTVYAWGLGTTGQIGNAASGNVYIPTQVVGLNGEGYLTNIKQIDAGGIHTLALTEEGTVYAWGRDTEYQLGNGANGNQNRPVQVKIDAETPLTGIEEISAIYQTSYARTKDGKVYGWGLNTSGQIGDYTITNKGYATPVKTDAIGEIEDIKSLSDGQYTHTNYMIDRNGNIYGNGIATSYELISNRTANTFFAIKLDETYLKINNNQDYVEVGTTFNLDIEYHNGLNLDNILQVGNLTYKSSDENIATVDNTGKVTTKTRGQVTIIVEDKTNGYKAEAIINVVSKNAKALPMVVSGTTFTAYLKEDGTVWTSGAITNGALGNGSNVAINTPMQVKINTNEYLTDVKKIAVGEYFVVALKTDGKVYAWGLNSSGQLGNGGTATASYATEVKNETGDGYLENIIDIDAGADNVTALTKEGKVYAWGDATYNGLGINNATAQKLPVLVHGASNVIQVQSGINNVIVLKGDGTVWGAGQNNVGQLGDTTTIYPRTELVPAVNNDANGMLTGIVRIASGQHHTIALSEDKGAWIWGYNNYGQQGINSTENQLIPIKVTGVGNEGIMENICDIATGPYSTYVLTSEGKVYATGLNTTGELSIGTNGTVNVFTEAVGGNGEPLEKIATINKSQGASFGFAFTNGTVGVTGLGTSGQHGDFTWVNTNKVTKIVSAHLDTGDLYEVGINQTEKINVKGNTGFNLNINSKLSLGDLTYTSLNEEIAQVSEDGTITGIKEGTTGIKITDKTTELETTAQVVVGEREKDIYKIVSGPTHTVLLKNDGTVWTWGDNTNGELGKGTIGGKEATEAKQVIGVGGTGYLEDIVDIAAGGSFTIALKKNGQVVAWGLNDYGQLGSASDKAEAPIYVKDYNGNILTGVVDISAGYRQAVALKADGTVWNWGANNYGQLGNNTTVNSSYAVQVLDSTGSEYLTGVKQISSGGEFISALKEDGTVWSWGHGLYGQMGDTTASNRSLPVQARLNNEEFVTGVKKLVTGFYHTYVLTEDGNAFAWGYNVHGELGYGTYNGTYTTADGRKLVATKILLEDIVDISANTYNGYAIDSNGEVYAWGYNGEGAVGDNTTVIKATPTKPLRIYGEEFNDKIIKLMDNSAYGYTNYMIREDGSILANGRISNGQVLNSGLDKYRTYVANVSASYLEITDKNSYIKIGDTKKLEVQTVENLNVLVKAPEYGNLTWKSTNEEIAVVDENGNVTAKGEGETTIIVTEDLHGYKAQTTIYVTRNTDKTITIPQVEQGFNFTIVLKADGSVWATGANTNGECGIGKTDATINTLTEVKLADGSPLTNIVKISAGYQHALALTADGKVYSWGLNTSGQLGINTNVNSIYAVEMLNTEGTEAVKDIIDIAAGGYHSAVLAKDGKVYSTGYNAHGELGNATNANSLILTKTEEVYNIVSLSGGMYYTTMLRGDGTVWTVGYNYYGHLGINTTQTGSAAASQGVTIARQAMNNTRDGALKNVIQISAGGWHTAVLTSNNEVYTWGYGVDGQLGLNSTTNYAYPQKLLDPTDLITSDASDGDGAKEVIGNIAKIGTTERGIFIITNDKKVYATGENSNYQLSQNNNTDVKVIKQLYSKDKTNHIEDVINVSSSCGNTNNTAIITSNGTVWVSGLGSSGQIGNGGTATATVYTEMGVTDWQIDSSIQIGSGEEKQLDISVTSLGGTFNVYGIDEENKDLKYESLNEDIVEISETGLLRGKRPGRTEIKVTHVKTGISRNIPVHCVQIVTDIVQGVRDTDLPNGNYTFRVINGAEKKDYEIELINYYDDVTYSSNVSLGDSTTEYKMLVVKYHKNLTINSGVTVTANRSGNYTYKKGMYLCVMGELKNYGTISMTARGTYNCPGENVYLWKNADGTFEYVPAVGGAGGSSVNRTSNGHAGATGTARRTGGGGSGASYGYGNGSSGGSGAGSAGTSYSGGSGRRWKIFSL